MKFATSLLALLAGGLHEMIKMPLITATPFWEARCQTASHRNKNNKHNRFVSNSNACVSLRLSLFAKKWALTKSSIYYLTATKPASLLC